MNEDRKKERKSVNVTHTRMHAHTHAHTEKKAQHIIINNNLHSEVKLVDCINCYSIY